MSSKVSLIVDSETTLGDVYEVTREGGKWQCSCKDYYYRNTYVNNPLHMCKHIKLVQSEMAVLEAGDTEEVIAWAVHREV